MAVAGLSLPAPASALRWCGNDVAQTDRLPEAVAARQIHVVYAIPSDGADRFAASAGPIVTDVAAIDAWWRAQDAGRAPRFDLFAFPGCDSTLGLLDLSFVRLAHDAAYFSPIETRLQRLITDLAAPPGSFGNGFKRYLVYYDAPVDRPDVCGFSPIVPDRGGFPSLVFLQACPSNLGQGLSMALTAGHELIHNLGAVVDAAPHRCADSAHVCDNGNDSMSASFNDASRPLSTYALDVGRDDYYGHSGPWFDVQDSPWLSHLDAPQFELSVAITGKPADKVTSDFPGIDCPTACRIPWDSGTPVSLSAATGDEVTRFVGWRGACTGAQESCALVMDAPKSVTAVFGPSTFRVAVSVAGRGRVTAPGFSCSRRCAEAFDADTRVRFRAVPAKGWRFTGWSGSCRGTRPCSVRIDAARTLRATFRRR
ncbi:MAG: InlB B-repeat-containing protein [Gaiellaceae bacterium]